MITDAIKILVVDEHPAILDAIQKAVAKRGWKVVGAASPDAAQGHVAANIAAEETPDIVLISLAFPNKAGLKFFTTARSHPALKNIPFLGLCLKAATFEQNDAKDTGFAGCITKPLDQLSASPIFERETVTGEWLGARLLLEDWGVSLFGSYTAEV